MSDPERRSTGRLVRRLWHGGFGAFTGAIAGMILAAIWHIDLVESALYGALAGLLIGFFLGLAAVEAIADWSSY